mmetsp:Transcript_35993/g.64403  ORF Transcript_35993/g.64403 Transcript_35993/m.64403 type:complete len:260 (-) Transcript_35993:4537-5316(-)
MLPGPLQRRGPAQLLLQRHCGVGPGAEQLHRVRQPFPAGGGLPGDPQGPHCHPRHPAPPAEPARPARHPHHPGHRGHRAHITVLLHPGRPPARWLRGRALPAQAHHHAVWQVRGPRALQCGGQRHGQRHLRRVGRGAASRRPCDLLGALGHHRGGRGNHADPHRGPPGLEGRRQAVPALHHAGLQEARPCGGGRGERHDRDSHGAPAVPPLRRHTGLRRAAGDRARGGGAADAQHRHPGGGHEPRGAWVQREVPPGGLP